MEINRRRNKVNRQNSNALPQLPSRQPNHQHGLIHHQHNSDDYTELNENEMCHSMKKNKKLKIPHQKHQVNRCNENNKNYLLHPTHQSSTRQNNRHHIQHSHEYSKRSRRHSQEQKYRQHDPERKRSSRKTSNDDKSRFPSTNKKCQRKSDIHRTTTTTTTTTTSPKRTSSPVFQVREKSFEFDQHIPIDDIHISTLASSDEEKFFNNVNRLGRHITSTPLPSPMEPSISRDKARISQLWINRKSAENNRKIIKNSDFWYHQKQEKLFRPKHSHKSEVTEPPLKPKRSSTRNQIDSNHRQSIRSGSKPAETSSITNLIKLPIKPPPPPPHIPPPPPPPPPVPPRSNGLRSTSQPNISKNVQENQFYGKLKNRSEIFETTINDNYEIMKTLDSIERCAEDHEDEQQEEDNKKSEENIIKEFSSTYSTMSVNETIPNHASPYLKKAISTINCNSKSNEKCRRPFHQQQKNMTSNHQASSLLEVSVIRPDLNELHLEFTEERTPVELLHHNRRSDEKKRKLFDRVKSSLIDLRSPNTCLNEIPIIKAFEKPKYVTHKVEELFNSTNSFIHNRLHKKWKIANSPKKLSSTYSNVKKFLQDPYNVSSASSSITRKKTSSDIHQKISPISITSQPPPPPPPIPKRRILETPDDCMKSLKFVPNLIIIPDDQLMKKNFFDDWVNYRVKINDILLKDSIDPLNKMTDLLYDNYRRSNKICENVEHLINEFWMNKNDCRRNFNIRTTEKQIQSLLSQSFEELNDCGFFHTFIQENATKLFAVEAAKFIHENRNKPNFPDHFFLSHMHYVRHKFSQQISIQASFKLPQISLKKDISPIPSRERTSHNNEIYGQLDECYHLKNDLKDIELIPLFHKTSSISNDKIREVELRENPSKKSVEKIFKKEIVKDEKFKKETSIKEKLNFSEIGSHDTLGKFPETFRNFRKKNRLSVKTLKEAFEKKIYNQNKRRTIGSTVSLNVHGKNLENDFQLIDRPCMSIENMSSSVNNKIISPLIRPFDGDVILMSTTAKKEQDKMKEKSDTVHLDPEQENTPLALYSTQKDNTEMSESFTEVSKSRKKVEETDRLHLTTEYLESRKSTPNLLMITSSNSSNDEGKNFTLNSKKSIISTQNGKIWRQERIMSASMQKVELENEEFWKFNGLKNASISLQSSLDEQSISIHESIYASPTTSSEKKKNPPQQIRKKILKKRKERNSIIQTEKIQKDISSKSASISEDIKSKDHLLNELSLTSVEDHNMEKLEDEDVTIRSDDKSDSISIKKQSCSLINMSCKNCKDDYEMIEKEIEEKMEKKFPSVEQLIYQFDNGKSISDINLINKRRKWSSGVDGGYQKKDEYEMISKLRSENLFECNLSQVTCPSISKSFTYSKTNENCLKKSKSYDNSHQMKCSMMLDKLRRKSDGMSHELLLKKNLKINFVNEHLLQTDVNDSLPDITTIPTSATLTYEPMLNYSANATSLSIMEYDDNNTNSLTIKENNQQLLSNSYQSFLKSSHVKNTILKFSQPAPYSLQNSTIKFKNSKQILKDLIDNGNN